MRAAWVNVHAARVREVKVQNKRSVARKTRISSEGVYGGAVMASDIVDLSAMARCLLVIIQWDFVRLRSAERSRRSHSRVLSDPPFQFSTSTSKNLLKCMTFHHGYGPDPSNPILR